MSRTITELTNIWAAVLSKIEGNLDARIYDSFFRSTKIDRMEGNTLIVATDTSLAANLLTAKYMDSINEAILEVTGTDFAVKFVPVDDLKKQAEPEKEVKGPEFFADSHLNSKFTFDNFVVGPSNREAYQASLMISSTPGQLYNPLLLYSDSGLGKTHLLHAIGNAIKEKSPKAKILYISASDFVNEYIKFAQGYKEDRSLVDYFRNDVDVLLIDDIQFLVGKKKTMEMFFVVFQTLATVGKQIVITSDQHPGNLDGMDERLKSRFAQGLVLSIDKPDLETSENILRSKIESNGLDPENFDAEVISFLAQKFSSNVRELEGALNRLIFFSINVSPSKHISMATATEAIRGLVAAQEDKSSLSETKIIATVADYYSLTPSQILSKIRTSRVAMARHIAMYLDRDLLGTPLIKIGQAFGGRDHTTVMNGVQKVESALKTDPDMVAAISDIKNKLNS